jgi:hypothetical protein
VAAFAELVVPKAVVECEIPSVSMLAQNLAGTIYFRDSYRAPLAHPERDIVELFHAVFAHKPLLVKCLLIARNKAAGLAGLEVPTVAEIMNPELKASYQVGEKIGPWPIFFLGRDEIVAGRNNRHLDFRVSVLKAADGDSASLAVSTVCTVHNFFGKVYLFLIGPFHRRGVQLLISNAVRAQRI